MRFVFTSLLVFILCPRFVLAQKQGQAQIDSLIAELPKARQDTHKVNLLNKLSMFAGWRVSNFDDAFHYARQAKQLAEVLNFKKGIANSYNNIGITYNIQRNYPEALENYRTALKIREEIRDKPGIATTYNNIGVFYSNQGNYSQALKNYRSALKIREEINDKQGIAACYHNIGMIYNNQGDYPEAMKMAIAALKVHMETGDKYATAKSYASIAAIYQNLDNYTESLKNSLFALKAYEEVGDKNGIGETYTNIGNAYFGQGNYAEALRNYLAGLKIAEEIGVKVGIAYAHHNTGLVYSVQGNYPEAMRSYLAALKIREEIGEKHGLAGSYAAIGELYLKQGKTVEAKEWTTKGLKLGEEIGAKTLIGSSYALLASADTTLGNYKGAYENYTMYTRYKDSLFNEENTKKLTRLETQYEFDKREDSLKVENEKRELMLQKEMQLTALRFEYEKKQAAARSEKEKQQLQYEEELNRQRINHEYEQKQQQLEAEHQKNLAAEKAKQESQKAASERTRNLLFGGIALLALVAGFLYWNNRQKQKAKSKVEKAYSELKATQQQLIQSEKMASLGALTAGIAHEIQNPLNFVNNFSEVSKELLDEMQEALEKGDMEDARDIVSDVIQNLEKINHHGNRAGDIVKSMLQHSRTSSGKKELTDLNVLCDEYLRLAYHGLLAKDKSGTTARLNITHKTDLDSSLSKVNIVQQEMGMVILNLINNAFYAVTEKKKQNEDGYEPVVTVSTKKQNAKVEIKVTDNGTGIPQKNRDKIFQPFFTTKPTGQGTGLGLSLSYDIVKAHGGDLVVESTEGSGTSFRIILPEN